MKRKVLAFLCIWSLLLSLFAVPAFAVKENYTTLKEANVAAVASPAAGTEPLYTAESQTKGAVIGAVEWYQKTEKTAAGTKMQAGDKFIPGYYYAVSVTMKGEYSTTRFRGKENGGVTATVNGKPATVTGNEGLYNVDFIVISYTFDLCMGTVSKFDLSLAVPAAGAQPSYAQIKGTGYETNNSRNNGAAYRNGIYWSNDTDNKVLYPDENPTFEAGKKYTAHVVILTTTGYKIASSYTVTVNGKTVTAGVEKIDNECLSVDYSFSVPTAAKDNTDKTPNADKAPAVNNTPPADKAPATDKAPAADKTPAADKAPVSGKPDASAPSVEETPEADVPTQAPVEEDTNTEHTEGEKAPKGSSNTGLVVVIIVLAVLLLGAGGFIVYTILKKKKN